MTNNQEHGILLKPYTIAQLSEMYGVSRKTFGRWLKPFAGEIGVRTGHFYTIAQVKCILTRLGLPGNTLTD